MISMGQKMKNLKLEAELAFVILLRSDISPWDWRLIACARCILSICIGIGTNLSKGFIFSMCSGAAWRGVSSGYGT